MDYPDYIPDVEEASIGAPVSTNGNAKSGTDSKSIRDMAEAWQRSLHSPMSFEDFRNEAAKVKAFGWRMVDFLCSGGTCPPPESLAPELVAQIRKVEVLEEGFDALVSKGVGHVTWLKTDPRYQRFVDICTEVFKQADILMNRVNDGSKQWSNVDPRKFFKNPLTKGESDGFGFWKGAIAVTLGIVAVSTFSDLIKSVRGGHD
jgi:hypothetical protein